MKTSKKHLTLNLLDCFPEGASGIRGPLPKQDLFLEAALGSTYKYIRYSGGVGSGKTLIGCIALLHMIVMEQGDYLIGRQFMPELKATTYKTFKEICPIELVVEDRIADMEMRIRTASGGISTLFFRGLEEPDKLRSLNLNAFLIDEAAQVSEAAFMLLQGRLRGRAFRKGLLVQNPGGHDWAWRWFVQQGHIANEAVKRMFLNIRAPSTENIHLPDGYVDSMVATWSPERIKREIEGSDDSFEGMVYAEFDRSVHVIPPFRVPENWPTLVGIDHGYRNEAAWVYGALSPDGDLYVFDEFYEKEWLIEEITKKGKGGKPSAYAKLKGRTLEQARIDPSVKATRGTTGRSDYDHYLTYLPGGFPILMANNDVGPGIDKVKQYMKPDSRGKPRLYIFATCTNLLDEMSQYKWQELAPSQQSRVNEKEKPIKNHDHALDALRYLIMACPDLVPKDVNRRDKLQWGSIERMLFDELQNWDKPKHKHVDPFG